MNWRAELPLELLHLSQLVKGSLQRWNRSNNRHTCTHAYTHTYTHTRTHTHTHTPHHMHTHMYTHMLCAHAHRRTLSFTIQSSDYSGLLLWWDQPWIQQWSPLALAAAQWGHCLGTLHDVCLPWSLTLLQLARGYISYHHHIIIRVYIWYIIYRSNS